MRWVVSILLVFLVVPLALAFDITVVETNSSFYSTNPVDISFTTDVYSSCSYSLTQHMRAPDFNCEPSICTFETCSYTCLDREYDFKLNENIILDSSSTQTHLLSLNTIYGYYDVELSCISNNQKASHFSSFLYDTKPIRIDWSLLTRERFATNQDSTFYALLYGAKKVESVQVTLSYPDGTNSTSTLGSFTPDDGYIFSYDITDLAIAGKHNLLVAFNYKDDEGESDSLVLSKDFLVVDRTTFNVQIDSYGDVFDIDFIDPITDIVSFSQKRISSKQITVPSSRLDLRLSFNPIFSIYFQDVDMKNYDLNAYFRNDYVLETNVIGKNKPLKELASYIFHTNESPEYITKVVFDYSALDVRDPQKLQIFKAKAKTSADVDITSGEFYQIGSLRNPLYIDEAKQTAHIFVTDFSLFSLVEEQQIGEAIVREPTRRYVNFSFDEMTLEGIPRDIWTFTYDEKEYSFLINTVDGAIVYFEYSPFGKVKNTNVGNSLRHDLDDDETDDIEFFVDAVTPSKVIFSVVLLAQPIDESSLEAIIGEEQMAKLKQAFTAKLALIVFGSLVLIIIILSIILSFTRKEKVAGLSKAEIAKLESGNKNKQPIVVYIEKLRHEGMADSLIKSHLISAGWPKDVVEKVLGDVQPVKKEEEKPVEKEIVKEEKKDNIDLINEPLDEKKVERHVSAFAQLAQEEETHAPSSNPVDLTHDEQVVLAYVKGQLAKNISQEDIKKKLIHIGWHQDIITKIFNDVK